MADRVLAVLTTRCGEIHRHRTSTCRHRYFGRLRAFKFGNGTGALGHDRDQLPDEVLFVDDVPLTSTGKMDKKVVRADLAEKGYLLPDLR